MITRHLIILTLMTAAVSFGQNFVWPVPTGTSLSSNFGEFRPAHFHMGIDIRTNQTEGHPVYAIESGFISRMSTNYSGYGKALYLTTNEGRKTLYGHLSKYSPTLDSLLHSIQLNQQSYRINEYFDPGTIPVKRGDIIGYSGNTGGSFGPHLHFELRNLMDQPLNPLVYGYQLKDSTPPVIRNITVLPYTARTLIQGSPLPQTFVPPSSGLVENQFPVLPDTISITGAFMISAWIEDMVQGASNVYQFYKAVLTMNGQAIFSVSYDSLDFSQDRYVETVHGQPPGLHSSSKFHKLYRLTDYPRLPIHQTKALGIINPSPGYNRLGLKVWDQAGNTTERSLIIHNPGNGPEKIDYLHSELGDLEEEKASDQSQTKVSIRPYYIESGAYLIVKTNMELGNKPALRIRHGSTHITTELLRSKDTVYSTRLLYPGIFSEMDECVLMVEKKPIHTFNELPPLTAFDMEEAVTVFSANGDCAITITQKSLFRPGLFWIKTIPNPALKYDNKKKNINNAPVPLSAVYRLQPGGIPVRTSFKAMIRPTKLIPSEANQLALYYYDEQQDDWTFMESSTDPATGMITADMSEFTAISLFKDNQAPVITSVYPVNRSTIPQDELHFIRVLIHDDLSGIRPDERTLFMTLNGHRLISEYQPVDRELTHHLRKPLEPGDYELEIVAEDRAGNSAPVRIKFSVE
ncbi:MAG: M23 family metallopeptidase [Candidatus Neomarinimicrobiota bacterium]